MIEELVNDMGGGEDRRPDNHYIPEDTFARAGYMIGSRWQLAPVNNGSFEKDIRLPWIHKSDPADVHPSNTLPSVNHTAPLLR